MEASGIAKDQAFQSIYVIDMYGLVHTGLPNIPPHQRPFARNSSEIKKWNVADPSHVTLLDVIKAVRPTVLIGVSTQSGAFTEEIVTTMARYTERPIIFPLSNPLSKCEAHPTDLLEWTKGKAIIATGSPFSDVSYQGRNISVAQCNNVYIFPGIGLGAVACGLKEITDTMFYKAAQILSYHSPMLKNPSSTLFPPFEKLRSISREIALGVIEIAEQEGLNPKTDQKTREKMVDHVMWSPAYENYK
jgi:malate dehydrogenase (oxaloacetate-decarboxylating)